MAVIGEKHPVDARLAKVLGHFYTIRTPLNMEPSLYHLSPSLEMMVVFNFGTPVRFSFGEKKIDERTIHHIGLIGPLRQMMNYELTGGVDLLVLPFIYNGFYRLFSLAVDGFNFEDETAVLKYVGKLENLWKQLSLITDTKKRIAEITAYLLASILENDEASLGLLEGVPAIHNPIINPVKAIATKEAVSERSIQLRFKKYTGYSPKELVRFLRFKELLTDLFQSANPQKINWMDLVMRYGYHDQSHLIKDFKYFTGVSPKKFLSLTKDGSFCFNRE
jgi:AraC-like DNA-binding protein